MGFLEFLAKDVARRACVKVFSDGERRRHCIEVITRVLAYGTSDRSAVEELRRSFTDEERERIREELERILKPREG